MQNVLEILIWYKNNFRDLPWRTTQDPYKIWLSEVILQQTQVIQGLTYYESFVKEYPNIGLLAVSDEQNILKLWQGLGYYSRARNLHKTAQIVHFQHNDKFPNTFSELLKLPGIGHYTASAIMSFAFNRPYPVLDGNVFRVISRWFDIDYPIHLSSTRNIFIKILDELIIHVNPSDFNNALMELGALVCKPVKPDCNNCPISLHCISKAKGNIAFRPVKSKKTIKKKRYFNFVFISYRNHFYIHKRPLGDIWSQLFQLPLIESDALLKNQDFRKAISNKIFKNNAYSIVKKIKLKHILTHQIIIAQCIHIKVNEKPDLLDTSFILVDKETYIKYPIPTLVEKFILSL